MRCDRHRRRRVRRRCSAPVRRAVARAMHAPMLESASPIASSTRAKASGGDRWHKRKTAAPLVGVVMGSDSDWDVMQHAAAQLDALRHRRTRRASLSAHRMPDDMFAYAEDARPRGLRFIIAGAGGAAHLPGMLAAKTTVPVLGVPVPSKYLRGEDSLLSIVQMPKGIPVATFAIGEAGAANAGAVRGRDPRGDRCRRRASKLAAFRVQADGDARARCACRPRHDGVTTRRADPAGRMAGAAGRRPARPHVLHGRAEPGLQGRGARPGQRRARPGASPTGTSHADYLDTRGLARARGARAARRRPSSRTCRPPRSSSSRARARVTPTAASVAIAQDRIREKTFLSRPRLRRRAVSRCCERRADAARCGRRAPARHRQERAHGLRRQGTDPRRTRRRRRARRVRRWARRRACSRSSSTSRAKCRSSSRARARRDVDVAGRREPASRRHPRRLDRPGARAGRRSRRARATSPRASPTALDYRGVLCVEMFVTRDGALLVNEIAPRPHNSGHYTIDACVTSQFEQQARVLAGLPLGDPRQHDAAVMVNLLGDLWFDDAQRARASPTGPRVLRQPQAKLHLYGKAEPRRGRKMGHVTCLGPDARRQRSRPRARSSACWAFPAWMISSRPMQKASGSSVHDGIPALRLLHRDEIQAVALGRPGGARREQHENARRAPATHLRPFASRCSLARGGSSSLRPAHGSIGSWSSRTTTRRSVSPRPPRPTRSRRRIASSPANTIPTSARRPTRRNGCARSTKPTPCSPIRRNARRTTR